MTHSDEQSTSATTEDVVEPRPVVPSREGRRVVKGKGKGPCQFCRGHVRRSRFRASDVLKLLTLRYPVRCTRCSQRQHVAIPVALFSFSSKHVEPRQANEQETWKNWTSADAPIRTSHPLSTAIGPKASTLKAVATHVDTEPPTHISSQQQTDSSIG